MKPSSDPLGDVYVNIAGREPVFVPGTSVLKFIQKWNEATARVERGDGQSGTRRRPEWNEATAS